MQKEIWKEVPSFEGLYEVSTMGRVRSLERYVKDKRLGKRKINKKIKNNRIAPNGYYRTCLHKDGKRLHIQIHQLVAMAFLDHIRNGYTMVINHKDFNKLNNNVSNLEIVTIRENSNKLHLKSTSKYIGVSWNKINSNWNTHIQINGKTKYLGSFKNEHIASVAYQLELSKLIYYHTNYSYQYNQS